MLSRRYLVNREGERTAVSDDYELPTAMRTLGFRVHEAEDTGTVVGDITRLREQLEEVARNDPAIAIDTVLEAIDEILAQNARRQEVHADPNA